VMGGNKIAMGGRIVMGGGGGDCDGREIGLQWEGRWTVMGGGIVLVGGDCDGRQMNYEG
jgi:hypothetical protein